ncbi:uncharacterized protein [Asterias amurensis]|uniref:uncharacterized protein n=1 Tax=Asterias amurensis TaxID=7602 RepID=UPI003AB34BA2
MIGKEHLQLMFTFLLAFVTTVNAVIFRQSPEGLILLAGKTAVFRCSVEPQANDRGTVKWLHVDTNRILSKYENILVYDKDNRYSIVGTHNLYDEYSLSIEDIRASDTGEYRCTYGRSYRSAFLTVASIPEPGYPLCDVNPDSNEQVLGANSELSCTSHGGNPPAELVWYREDVAISKVAYRRNVVEKTVGASDNGVKYTCVAEFNPALEIESRSCEILVLNKPPSGTVHPKTHIVQPGTSATYDCTGEGIPTVTGYTWLVNYIYVSSKDNRGRRYVLLNNNRTLRITDVRRWEDGAVITCEMTILSGLKGRAFAKLSVVSSPVVTSEANGSSSNPRVQHPEEETTNPFEDAGPAERKPQANSTTGGVVAGAVLATIGVVLALVAVTVLFIRTKLSGQFSPDATRNKSKKCPPGPPVLPVSSTLKRIGECPIYAKPNKARKGLAPAPPGVDTLLRGNLGTQMNKSRKNRHSYEKVDVLGLSNGGTIKLQGRSEAHAGSRSETLRSVKGPAPLPPDRPPSRPVSPAPRPPPLMPPPPTPKPPNDLLYADLDLVAETTNKMRVSTLPYTKVDYAILTAKDSKSS